MEKPQLSRYLFWDTDPETVDLDSHPRYVIEKVVSLGQLEDWNKILSYYGAEKVKEEVLQIRYLDNKTLHFLSFYFKVPIEEFRCYKHRQSIPAHYPY